MGSRRPCRDGRGLPEQIRPLLAEGVLPLGAGSGASRDADEARVRRVRYNNRRVLTKVFVCYLFFRAASVLYICTRGTLCLPAVRSVCASVVLSRARFHKRRALRVRAPAYAIPTYARLTAGRTAGRIEQIGSAVRRSSPDKAQVHGGDIALRAHVAGAHDSRE